MRELRRGEEENDLGFSRVGELVVSDESYSMRDLLGGRGENGVELGDMGVHRGVLVGNCVYKQMVPGQSRASDLLNLMRDSGRE